MRLEINQNWQLCDCDADSFNNPVDLEQSSGKWLEATVPGTVAASLRDQGLWSIDDNVDFDAKDWWYRTKFNLPEGTDFSEIQLHFDGLATLCDIWLNGEMIGTSQNMFLPLRLPIAQVKHSENYLYLHFKSLSKALSEKKPRPRWKTNLIENQKLRYFRTSLLGRIPGWSTGTAPVGPWRAVKIVSKSMLSNLKVIPSLSNKTGRVAISFRYDCGSNMPPEFRLLIGDNSISLKTQSEDNVFTCQDTVFLEDVNPWWPHTHGTPSLYPAKLLIHHAELEESIDLPRIGFRNVDLGRDRDEFALSLNGRMIFCRGACWTPSDVVSLDDDSEALRSTLELLQASGANMIRIGGTMVYASQNLLELCDELGIMIWQDFLFANMDYPVEDEEFAKNIASEINEQIRRQSNHACLTIYCGNSEVEQQAAMMGIDPTEIGKLALPRLIDELHSDNESPVPLISSTPIGGGLPFHTNEGVAHYYAVGAYKRQLSDVRGHNVQFAAECLGFSNVPQKSTRDMMFSGKSVMTHHPHWKSGIPRDSGAGWDFEDVRDFYLNSRYGLDAIALRSQNPERYLRLSEVVSGEMMSRVMQEWRSSHSSCAGALIWFLKDLRPGAGWGIIDSNNRPKAAYYFLKQCWQPVSIAITDENLNGLHFHVINESADSISGNLILRVIKNGNVEVLKGSIPISVGAGNTDHFESTKILSQFFDVNYCYKFGPLDHDVVSIELIDNEQNIICDNYFFFDSYDVARYPHASVDVEASNLANDCIKLKIQTSHFLYRVNLDLPDYMPDDNFFNVMPGRVKNVIIRPMDKVPNRFRGYLSALSLDDEIRIASPLTH